MTVSELMRVATSETVGMARRRAKSYATRLVFTDALVISVAVYVAWRIRFDGALGTLRAARGTDVAISTEYPTFSALLICCWLVALQLTDSRESSILGTGPQEYKRVATATFWLFGVVGVGSYMLGADVARGYIALAFPIGLLGLLGSRRAWRIWLSRQRVNGKYLSPVLVVGDASHVLPTIRALARTPAAGLKVVGVCTPDHDRDRLKGLAPVLGRPEDTAAVALQSHVSGVIIASTSFLDPDLVKRIAWSIEGADIDLILSSALTDVAGPRIHIRPMAGLPLFQVEEPQFRGGNRVFKALFERGAALLGLVAISPLLLLLAFLVDRSGPGPVLYRQTRVGLRGESFSIFKFRTMVDGADAKVDALSAHNDANGVLFKLRTDPRVTPIGAVLRRWSLDELPQLFNVVNGTMALVGPRPPLPTEVDQYADHVRRRLLVKPGITGLWQVSGRSDLSWEESVRLDLSYVENWTFMGDLMILWRTVRAVVAGAGAY